MLCNKCRKVISGAKNHVCSDTRCGACGITHSIWEKCYIQKPKASAEAGKMRVVYADFESTVDSLGRHHVNFAAVKSSDGSRTWIYRGLDAVSKLTAACIARDSEFKQTTFVFLNSSGYDAHFWYSELCRIRMPPKRLIRRQQRILTMELPTNGIVIRDALLFIPNTPLSKYPAMFDLSCDGKGDFPHGWSPPALSYYSSAEVAGFEV
jgi:hypothetical protein